MCPGLIGLMSKNAYECLSSYTFAEGISPLMIYDFAGLSIDGVPLDVDDERVKELARRMRTMGKAVPRVIV